MYCYCHALFLIQSPVKNGWWNNYIKLLTYMYFSKYSVHWTRTIPSKGECSQTTPQHPSAPIINWDSPINCRCNPNFKLLHVVWQHFIFLLYLHGFVVPAVSSILVFPSSMEHHHGSVCVTEIHATGFIHAHQTQATLNHI